MVDCINNNNRNNNKLQIDLLINHHRLDDILEVRQTTKSGHIMTQIAANINIICIIHHAQIIIPIGSC